MERTPLRTLIVEDSELDAEVLKLELMRGGWEPACERVETAAAMRECLDRQAWDVILCDENMPTFSSAGALEIVRALNLDTPFIVVSGTISEELAVRAMRAGAHDFLVKGRLARLAPALERELREAALRAGQRRMREQMIVAERMASIGTLAAGVAHEVNNPLTVVIGNVDLALEQLRELTPAGDARAMSACEFLEDAREAAERVRKIVKEILIFSRSSEEERREPVDVRSVMESSLRLAANHIRYRAKLRREYREVPPVEGNESRLGQVFLNLLINAAQAIEEGSPEDNEIEVSIGLDGSGQIRAAVRDTGRGIAPEHMPRLFDPFFTTKAPGVGTGLGLATCHRIVEGFAGQIRVESTPGKGSVFEVVLPPAPVAAAVPAPPAGPDAPARRGRLLIVDDEAGVLRVMRLTLSPHHDVVTVNQAADALELLASGQRFDAILCDLMMPHVSGAELYAMIARIAPEQVMKVAFMTGGTFTSASAEFLDRVPNARIGKPFEVHELLSLVNRLVAG